MEFEEQIDWNNLLSFDDFDTNENISSIILPQNHNNFNSNDESISPPLSVDEIEQLLFNDDNGGGDELNYDIDDGFFNEIFVDSPPPVEPSGSGGGEVVNVSDDSENKNVTAVNDDHNDDDPLAKKRKRQLRNKDAALKSRERKKMYVKDLEMKSRYYEGECRRLGSLLQCVMAENQALCFSLHSINSSKAFNASMTKQESAVLFLESLLLGSLLWLMGIVCQLVVLPSLHQQTQRVTVVEENLPNVALRNEGSKMSWQTLLVGKRFKASRSRMRLNLHSLRLVRDTLAVF
uniref:bZIP transcription factor 60-like n=1 Tax=Erigeron canadensis TaxID=72917 RepID=UPI001CB9D2A0|nr:bZIP transcription factor 60-like [Erigeron canadensis]